MPFSNQKGMTLLEIMIALLILGTVVTMVSVTLSGSLKVLNATMDKGEVYHRAQITLERISEDLASAILVDDVDFVGNDEQQVSGQADTLQFTSTAHVVFNQETDRPGLAVISYTVGEDPDREGELVLYRSDELLAKGIVNDGQADQQNGYLLCDRLRSVNFRYYGADGEEADEWTTKVEDPADKDKRKLPVAVSCTLEFWLDKTQETSIEFSTSVLLPVGLINAQYDASIANQ